MTSIPGDWAVVDLAIPGDAGVLLIVDTRDDAESIAFELRRRGQRVAAVGLSGDVVVNSDA